jgi:hypothetical protein
MLLHKAGYSYMSTLAHPTVSLVSHLCLNVTHFLDCMGYVLMDGRTFANGKLKNVYKEALP